MNNLKFGAVPSPKDEKDFTLARLAPIAKIIPKDLDIVFPKVKYQESDSCVANSLCCTRERKESEQSGTFKPFSVGFIYINRKPTDYLGDGMVPRQALDGLLKSGDVLESDFPYDEDYNVLLPKFTAIKSSLLPKAVPHKITAYAKINTDIEYRSAMLQGLDTTIMIPVYESFLNVKSDGSIPLPNPSKETLLGMHEVTGSGWKGSFKKILNSWGESWGCKGYGFLPNNYPIQEMWSITDAIIPDTKPTDGRYFRVQLGKIFSNTQATVVMMARLKADKYKPIIEKVGGCLYIQLGAFPLEKQAIDLKEKLKNDGYSCTIKHY